MAKARLWKREWEILPGGLIIEIRIWLLPAASPERPHGLKYSLFFGRPGLRTVGYDNEAGKGDHRHYLDREEPYRFETLEKLERDFRSDVARYGGGQWPR